MNPPDQPTSSDLFEELVRKHNLAIEALTEQQLADVIRQAIASGDLMRYVSHDGAAQAVTYIPRREIGRLRALYYELIHAVATKHDGETRHETALRYIQERGRLRLQDRAKSRLPRSAG